MGLAISTALLDAIRAQAQAAGEAECCGLLLGEDDHVTTILPADNVATEPRHRFEIDPAMLIRAHRAARTGGPAIIGHYHSHPQGNSEPSLVDAAMAQGNGEIWLIVGRGGGARAWRAVSIGALHGRFEPLEITAPAHHDLAPAAVHRH